VAVKRSNFVPVAFSAAVALIASLVVIVFTSGIGMALYLLAVAILGALALLLAIALHGGRGRRIMSVAVFGAFLTVTAGMVVLQWHTRPHLLWLIWSHRYKSEVLVGSAAGNGEFKHMEWDGDGWGDGVSGDWMGYVVYDPSDSLSAATKNNAPTEYKGIPCKVILVRRLERQWYSVVLDMNQFWDKMHPGC